MNIEFKPNDSFGPETTGQSESYTLPHSVDFRSVCPYDGALMTFGTLRWRCPNECELKNVSNTATTNPEIMQSITLKVEEYAREHPEVIEHLKQLCEEMDYVTTTIMKTFYVVIEGNEYVEIDGRRVNIAPYRIVEYYADGVHNCSKYWSEDFIKNNVFDNKEEALMAMIQYNKDKYNNLFDDICCSPAEW